MSQLTSRFSIKDTQAMKGIAILLMLCHHLFYATEQYVNYFIYYTFDDEFNITARIAMYAKMCVPIFVLLSGYGLSLSFQRWREKAKSNLSFVADRFLALYSGFVVIFVLGLAAGVYLERSLASIYGEGGGSGLFLALDSLGLSSLFHTPTANVTWWYLSFAIVQIMMLPLLQKLADSLGPVSALLIFGLIFLGFGGYYLILMSFALLGICLANGQGFDRARAFKPFRWPVLNYALKLVLYGLVFWVLFLFCEYLPSSYDGDGTSKATNFSYLGQGLFGVTLCFFAYEFLFPLKPLRFVLAFLGRHSANIFLMHTFFYHYFFEDFFYAYEEPELILGMLLLVTLGTSVALELLKKLCRYQKGVAKLRAWVSGKLNPAGVAGASPLAPAREAEVS